MKRTGNIEMASIVTIVGMGVLSLSVLSPMLPLYLTSINVTPDVLGLMFAVAMVGTVIGETSSGWLADRIGVKVPLAVASFASALAVFCFLLTQSVPMIFVFFFFWGLVRSAIYGPSRGYIGANTSLEKRATSMAVLTVVITGARSLGALPGGFMVDGWGYNSVFFTSSAIAALGGLVVVIGLRKIRLVEPAVAESSPLTDEGLASNLHKVSLRSLVPQFVVAILQFLGLGTLMTFGPLLATEVIGVRATEVGILFTIAGVASMVMGIPMGILADRMGKKTFMVLGLLVSAAAMVGIAFVQSYSWFIVFAIINGLGLVIFMPAALGLLSESVPVSKQSTIMGIYGGMCENAGLIAGSALGGFVWSGLGPQATFLMCSISAGLGLVICITSV
ncbi:MAG: MFS transporter, partial [Dehalococcoidales bacterium]